MRPILIGLLAVALVACGGSNVVEWRDLELLLPEGWMVFEERAALGIGNIDLTQEISPEEARERTADAVAMQFTHDPDTTAQDWRDFVVEQDGTLETDDRLTLDGIPATRLIYSGELNNIPTREMIVVVPARDIVILAQPLVTFGTSDGQERFLAHLDQFMAVLESIDFGAPLDR